MSLDFNNQKWTFRKVRVKYFEKFVDKKDGTIIVFGLDEFEKTLSPNANLINVDGDYNYSDWLAQTGNDFKTVYCFEVLEHLLNPHLFLESIRKILAKDGVLYLSFPTGRPVFLWTNGHFHEYQMKRAEKLFEIAGFEVEKKAKTGIIWKKWYEYFMGFRPLLRFFIPLRCAMYKLRISN